LLSIEQINLVSDFLLNFVCVTDHRFVPPFVTQVWNLLTTLGEQGKYDDLVINAIKFLTVVVSQTWHQELFGADHVLQTMCEKVVIPNIRLRGQLLSLSITLSLSIFLSFLFHSLSLFLSHCVDLGGDFTSLSPVFLFLAMQSRTWSCLR
jgi:hypothetical protein